jgi:pyrroline-5-carboxylate reductase
MKKRNVIVVGGGQMGRALVGGMLASQFTTATSLVVVDPSEDSRAWWAEHHPDVAAEADLPRGDLAGSVILLAVKPGVIAKVAADIGARAGDGTSAEKSAPATNSRGTSLIVSIAAGIPLQTITERVGHQRVVRVMPNTPSLVGAGASAYCTAEAVDEDDCQWIERALGGVGTVVRVAEEQMNAVTGLSGSGPAYICLVIEALADGGVLAGLPRPLAMTLAAQTVLGTAKMVMETGRHPGELKDAVASPGGTTIAALQVLEDRGLRGTLIGAVQASARRSAELG